MASPYVSPIDLLGNPVGPADAAPLGINFNNFSSDRLEMICAQVTRIVDDLCNQELRATICYEEMSAPSFRVSIQPSMGTARFVTARKPIQSVVAAQVAYGGPPWTFNAIPATSCAVSDLAPGSTTTTQLGQGGTGVAAVLIGGGYVNWCSGKQGQRVGVWYDAGYAHAGLLPVATPTGTLTSGSNTITGLSSDTGIVDGCAISGTGIQPGTTVESFTSSSITLSQPASLTTTGVVAIGYPPGATSLQVDDVTSFDGTLCPIYDADNYEQVSVLTSASSQETQGVPVGAGTLALANGTIFPHAADGVLISAMPGSVRWAAMLGARALALTRGATAVTIGGVPGRSTYAGQNAVKAAREEMVAWLAPYRRTY